MRKMNYKDASKFMKMYRLFMHDNTPEPEAQVAYEMATKMLDKYDITWDDFIAIVKGSDVEEPKVGVVRDKEDLNWFLRKEKIKEWVNFIASCLMYILVGWFFYWFVSHVI